MNAYTSSPGGPATEDGAGAETRRGQEHEQLIEELSAERARLRLALEAAELGDWELDLRTKSSPRRSLRHDRIFGYQEPKEDWSFETFIEHVHPDDRDRVASQFRRALELEEPWDFECRILRVDGSERWIWARGEAHRDRQGNPVRMLGVVRDVTDRKRAEQEREELLAEAERASRAKSDFLAVMSHELRTPMNAILGYVDLLLMGVPASIPDGARTQVKRVGTSARHLLSLIEQVLAFSRIEAGHQELNAEEVALDRLVSDACDLLEPLAYRKGLFLRFRPPDQAVTIETDVSKARQILINLIGNGIKFTEEGGVEVRVEADDDGGAVLAVEDTGIGIEASQIEAIFEPFRQAEQPLSRHVGGTGLGLAVTRQLVELLGGTVRVLSEPGQGSTFTVWLPRTLPPEARQARG
jgi:two-component system, chemotaxis family, sensor kinase Cph1